MKPSLFFLVFLISSLVFAAPTLEQPTELFDQTPQKEFDSAAFFKTCLMNGQTMATNAQGELLEECKPDTLYSWGNQNKLDWWKANLGENMVWPASMRDLFMSRSAVSTFGYGPIPIRIKLKKDVKFVSHPEYIAFDCQNAADKHIVFFRNEGRVDKGMWGSGYSDWIICSPSVIESWSFYGKPHYDEIIKDYRMAKKFEGGDYDGKYDTYATHIQSKSIFLPDIDQKSFTEETFKNTLSKLLEETLAGKAQIFFNPDVPIHERTPENHFATDHPIYFNEE